MKIINILNEEITLAKWVKPTENVIRNTLFNSVASPLSRALTHSLEGNEVPWSFFSDLATHTSENIRLALFDLAKKFSKVTGISLINNPDHSAEGFATWYENNIKLKFQNLDAAVTKFISKLFQFIDKIDNKVSQQDLTTAYVSSGFNSSTYEFVKTYLHELFHITQFTNGAETDFGPHQGSYLDNPKIPNEFKKLSRAKSRGLPYDKERWRELYLASPREIGAWANGVALDVIRVYKLRPGSGINNGIPKKVEVYIHKHIMDTAGVSIKNRLTKTERKIYLKYAKQVYKELVDYLTKETPDYSSVNITQTQHLPDLIIQEYPNFSPATMQPGMDRVLKFLGTINLDQQHTRKELRALRDQVSDQSVKDMVANFAYNDVKHVSKEIDSYIDTIFQKILPTLRTYQENINKELGITGDATAPAALHSPTYVYSKRSHIDYTQDLHEFHDDYPTINAAFGFGLYATDSEDNISNHRGTIYKFNVKPNLVLYPYNESTLNSLPADQQEFWEKKSAELQAYFEKRGIVHDEEPWYDVLSTDLRISELLPSLGVDGTFEDTGDGAEYVFYNPKSSLTLVDVDGKKVYANDYWKTIIAWYPTIPSFIRNDLTNLIIKSIPELDNFIKFVNSDPELSDDEREVKASEAEQLMSLITKEHVALILGKNLKLFDQPDNLVEILEYLIKTFYNETRHVVSRAIDKLSDSFF